MARRDSGGRKQAHSLKLRAEALRIARRRGATVAAKELGLRPGTVRSWLRRQHLKELREQQGDSDVLRALQEEGRRMLEERHRREAEEAEHRAAEQPAGAEPDSASEPPLLAPHLREFGRRRTAERLLDEAFPEEEPQPARERTWRVGDELVGFPPPEPPAPRAEREPTEEDRWRKLAAMTGRDARVAVPVDADGMRELERRRRGGGA